MREPCGPIDGPTETRRVAGLLLAAGAGRRYGMPKALVEHGDRLLVEHALATLFEAGCDPVVVVLGAAEDEVRARARLGQALVVSNADWASGMGSSLRAGLAALSAADVEACVVLLVDTPGVTAAAVRRVIRHAARDALAVATYGDAPGHPVLLGRAHWSRIDARAVGDAGARGYLTTRQAEVISVPCADISVGADIDLPPETDS